MSGLRPSPLSVDAGLVADAASPAPAVIAEDLPGNPCRLTADPLVRTDEPGGIRFDGRVRGIGRSIVSLRVLQASWRGPYRLRSIELDGKVVATGLGSPALVSLGGPEGMAVAPGTSQTLVLYFVPDPDAAPELFALGPVLFLSEDGCALPLFEGLAFPDGRCGLAIPSPTVPKDRPDQLEIVLENRGKQAFQPNAMELVWPVALNGSLRGWQVSYRPPLLAAWSAVVRPGPVIDGETAAPLQQLPTPPPGLELGRPPLLLPLGAISRGLLPAGGLPPRGSLVITLSFQRPVAADGYRVSIGTDEGCRSNWSDLPQDNGCAVSLQRLKLDQRTVALQLGNAGGLTTTLRSLGFQWDQRNAGALAEVWIGGKLLRTAKAKDSPFTVILDPPYPVLPGHFTDLALVFAAAEGPGIADGAATRRPSDDPGNSLGLGDLAVLARFSDGCGAVLSTVRPDEQLGCHVSGTDLVPDAGTPSDTTDMVSVLSNDGASARLRQIALRWPVHNGALTGVWLDDDPILLEALPHDPNAARLLTVPTDLPPLERNRNAHLRLQFEKPAARLGYTALLSFVDGTDAPCSEIRVSSPAQEPDCQLGTEIKVVDDSRADLTIQNRGQDPLTLGDIQVDWPKVDGWQLTRLLGASIVRNGVDELDLGLEPNLAPPVAVRMADLKLPPVSVPARSDSVRLSLRFTQLRDPGLLKDALKVSLAFAEGCRTAYPRDGSLPGPRRAVIDATVIKLPDAATLYTGGWQLRDPQGALWSVEVSTDTVLLPPSFVPRIGDRVEAELEADAAGLWWATQVTLRSGRPERKLVGEVNAIEPGLQPGDLPEWLMVDDHRVLLVDGFSQVDRMADLLLGATVLVEGIIDRQNRFVASRVDLVTPAVLRSEPITFRGVIQGGAPTGPNAPFPNVVMGWTVTPYAVFAGTELATRLGSLTQLLGRSVEVRGERMGDNVLATDIQLLAAPAITERLDGTLVGLPASGLQGDWTIEREVEGQRVQEVVHVPNLAVIDTREAPALLGNRVQAVVREAQGDRTVLGIRVLWP